MVGSLRSWMGRRSLVHLLRPFISRINFSRLVDIILSYSLSLIWHEEDSIKFCLLFIATFITLITLIIRYIYVIHFQTFATIPEWRKGNFFIEFVMENYYISIYWVLISFFLFKNDSELDVLQFTKGNLLVPRMPVPSSESSRNTKCRVYSPPPRPYVQVGS